MEPLSPLTSPGAIAGVVAAPVAVAGGLSNQKWLASMSSSAWALTYEGYLYFCSSIGAAKEVCLKGPC